MSDTIPVRFNISRRSKGILKLDDATYSILSRKGVGIGEAKYIEHKGLLPKTEMHVTLEQSDPATVLTLDGGIEIDIIDTLADKKVATILPGKSWTRNNWIVLDGQGAKVGEFRQQGTWLLIFLRLVLPIPFLHTLVLGGETRMNCKSRFGLVSGDLRGMKVDFVREEADAFERQVGMAVALVLARQNIESSIFSGV